MTTNALLKLNGTRAARTTEDRALAKLAELGFEKGAVVRHTLHKNNNTETIVTDYHRHSRNDNGSPRYDRARLTVTFSI